MSRKESRRLALFLALALLLVLAASAVFDRKLACHYTLSVNGFYNEPEQSVDVLALGSSRMYCTLNPLSLHHDTGLRAYLLSTQQQPLTASYYYLREALETQRPRLVLLEASIAFRPAAETGEPELRDALDPMRWGRSKLALIREAVPADERGSYYFNFLKYHQRWKELGARDFDFSWIGERDPFRGYICFTLQRGADCRQWSYDAVEAVPIPPENLETIRAIAALARDNGAELVLLCAPNEMVQEDLGSLRSLHRFCEEEGVALLDLNTVYDELGLDNALDYYDEGHFNVYGAIKATRWIGARLAERFALTPSPDPLDAELEAAYEQLMAPYDRELAQR